MRLKGWDFFDENFINSIKFYNPNINFIPHTKKELDGMDREELNRFKSSFITNTNWYKAKKDGIESKLLIYTKELKNYINLRFPNS